ncbi:AtpZ/AtpI family protein [Thioalkalivibrio sp. XN8]|uniref:AtpZ/AtpI family protein n=1 Tax=Thioalkalivibrio sp. XN8 TaxID=2712863 RepID=UPI001F104162|nr:AtpZ/AtpI family protein [Thioalkalivibrio sp. XN8]
MIEQRDQRRRGLGREVGRRAERKLEARRRPERSAWFGLGMFGLVGWSVAIPALAGIALGLWLDREFPGQASWTLTGLILGVALGCLNAWFWIRQERDRD